MRFGNDHKVIIDTLNEAEARAFIKFLESEIIRHQEDITQARDLIFTVGLKIGDLMIKDKEASPNE